MRKRASAVLAKVVLLVVCGHALAAEQSTGAGVRVRLVGIVQVPGDARDKSGLSGEDPSGVPSDLLGAWGSGIDFNPLTGSLVGVSDRGPIDGMSSFACRVHRFTLTAPQTLTELPATRESGSDASGGFALTLEATTMLRAGDGKGQFLGTLAASQGTLAGPGGVGEVPLRLDPESVRLSTGGAGGAGTMWISDEYGPWIDEFSGDGVLLRRLALPARYAVATPADAYEWEAPPNNTSGRLPNRGFESLAISPDGSRLFAMTQSPLIQDSSPDDRGRWRGENIRLLEVTLATGEDGAGGEPTFREVVYRLEHPRDGVNEVLALDEHRLLVLERDSRRGDEARSRRVFLVDVRVGAGGASPADVSPTDVSKVDALPARGLPEGIIPVAKREVIDFTDERFGLAGEAMPEKLEGLCWGPTVGGVRTLLVSSDNDLKSDVPSVVWVFAFEETPPSGEEPASPSAPAPAPATGAPSTR